MIFHPPLEMFSPNAIRLWKTSAKRILQNVNNTREIDEITTHSNKIPLLTTGSGIIVFFSYPAVENLGENDSQEGVDIPSAIFHLVPGDKSPISVREEEI